MARIKYDSDLPQKSTLSATDEFLIIDRSGDGAVDSGYLVTKRAPFTELGAAPLDIAVTGSGPISAVEYAFNNIVIGSGAAPETIDSTTGGGRKTFGVLVRHFMGGTAAQGGRAAVEARLNHMSPTAGDNEDRNYVGLVGFVRSVLGDGGTSGDRRGAFFGGNLYARLEPGAQHVRNVTGCEFNTNAQSGSSVLYKSGLQVHGIDEVQGINHDCMVGLSNTGAATVGWRHGLLIGNMAAQHPIATDGTLIGTVGSSTIANLIDCSSYTISGNYLLCEDYVLNPSLFRPIANNQKDLGAASFGWRNIYAGTGYYIGANQVVGARKTGWGTVSGTISRAAYTTYTAPTASAGYVQAELQGLMNAVQALSRLTGALFNDLHAATSGANAHGLIGT